MSQCRKKTFFSNFKILSLRPQILKKHCIFYHCFWRKKKKIMRSIKFFFLPKWDALQCSKLAKDIFWILGKVYKKFFMSQCQKKVFFELSKFWVLRPQILKKHCIFYHCFGRKTKKLWLHYVEHKIFFSSKMTSTTML